MPFCKERSRSIQDGVQFERVDNFTRFYEALIGFGPMKAKVAIALHAIPEFPTLASAIPFHQRSDNDQWNTITRTLTEQKKTKNNILARNKPRLLLLPSA